MKVKVRVDDVLKLFELAVWWHRKRHGAALEGNRIVVLSVGMTADRLTFAQQSATKLFQAN